MNVRQMLLQRTDSKCAIADAFAACVLHSMMRHAQTSARALIAQPSDNQLKVPETDAVSWKLGIPSIADSVPCLQVVLFWLQQLLKGLQAQQAAALSIWPQLATPLVGIQSQAQALMCVHITRLLTAAYVVCSG